MSSAVKKAVSEARLRRLVRKWGVKTEPKKTSDPEPDPPHNPPMATRDPDAYTKQSGISKDERAKWDREARDKRIAESKEREAEARVKRKEELVEARAACEAERKAVTVGCAVRRSRVRDKTRDKLEEERQKQREERLLHRALHPPKKSPEGKKHYGIKRGQIRVSPQESDSMALASIDPRYHDLFRRTRRDYPYSLQPGKRAELFNEWLDSGEAQEMIEAEAEALLREGELALAKAEREHFEERRAAAGDGVPF